MKEPPLTPEEALAMLRENAARLVAATDGQPLDRLHAAPEPGEWSAHEIVAHIRANLDIWGGNIRRILAEEHATFAGVSPRAWMKKSGYSAWEFPDALRTFLAQRQELLTTLDALPGAEWEHTATVTSHGQAHERSVRSYGSDLARHEQTHVEQIEDSLRVTPRSR